MLKHYVSFENDRNTRHAPLFVKLIQLAFGADEVVLSGHHFSFAHGGDITKGLNEIPSADTLLFDHEIMHRVFGSRSHELMVQLVKLEPDDREDFLAAELAKLPEIRPSSEITVLDPSTARWETEGGRPVSAAA